MRAFNLSEWALRNRALVVYAMLVLALIGAWSYKHLGQSEDPPFTFKAMVVRTLWPGATAQEVSTQVTERIEKQLMTTGQYEFIRAYSRPGESQVIFMARDSMGSKDVPELWYQVRKKVGDIRPTLPEGAVGPFFNDEFGDTFGNIYALTGEGFDYAVLKDYAERIELELQRVPDAGKVELIGLQDEKIWIEVSNTRLATLGIPLSAGERRARAAERGHAVRLLRNRKRPRAAARGRRFDSVQSIRDFPIRAGRSHLPHGRRRRSAPRLQRSRGAEDAFHGAGRDRHRGGDEGRRRHPRPGRHARPSNSPGCSNRFPPACSCARSATSPKRCANRSANSCACSPRPSRSCCW
jgi:multidrug efflux pump